MDSDLENSEEYSSSDDEIKMRKFCDVTIPKNFDPTKVPSTGEEYLQHVMHEAQNCLSVVTADIDITKLGKNQNCILTVNKGCERSHQSMLPSKAWQNQKIAEFTEFRKYIEHQLKNQNISRTVSSSNYLTTEHPSFYYISKLSASNQLSILEKLIDKLKLLKHGCTIDQVTSRWIFALLSVLDTPPVPNVCHTLRELAKECARIRSNLPSDTSTKTYTDLNFFICVIGVYFRQFDLVDVN